MIDELPNIVIFGASGHGGAVLECIQKEKKYNVIGFIDSFQKAGAKFHGFQVLGTEYDLPVLIDKFNLKGGIVAIGDNWTRRQMVDRIWAVVPHFEFISTVHPTATVAKNVSLGMGSVIMPGVVVRTNSVIGDFCILNTKCSLDHDGIMNNFSSLAPGVITGGNFCLGAYSAICLGAKVIENICVEEHSVIGSGALVLDDVANNVTVYGSPATVVATREIGAPYLNRSKRSSLIPIQKAK
jgi:sugar O-acyltransferase (sialic acid O-acetyltransferase NeuD family)